MDGLKNNSPGELNYSPGIIPQVNTVYTKDTLLETRVEVKPHEFLFSKIPRISSNATAPSCPVCRNTAISRENNKECLFCDLDSTDDEKDEIREIKQNNKIKEVNKNKGKNVVNSMENCEDEDGSTEIAVYIEDPVFSDKSYEFEVIF